MNLRFKLGAALSLFTVLTVAGCGGPKNEPDAMAERNQHLASQLSRAQSDLAAALQERNALNERLRSLMAEADSLRNQLNALPPEPAPAGWTAVPGGGMIAIEDGVLFAPGRNILRDEAKRTLDGITSTLQGEYGDKDIVIFGHTDDRPIKKSGWDDNWQLSTERALAVARFLQQHGITASRIVAAGCGEHRPRVANNNEPNRTANRRVEIFAIDPQALTGRTK